MSVSFSICLLAWQQKTEAVGPSSRSFFPFIDMSVQGNPAVSNSDVVSKRDSHDCGCNSAGN